MKTENEMWTHVINDARWYDGTPDMLVKMRERLKQFYTITDKTT